MRGENLLTGADVPTDSGIIQQPCRECRETKGTEQDNKYEISAGRQQPPKPCSHLAGFLSVRTSGTIAHRVESYK
jgi:hypothetical protein